MMCNIMQLMNPLIIFIYNLLLFHVLSFIFYYFASLFFSQLLEIFLKCIHCKPKKFLFPLKEGVIYRIFHSMCFLFVCFFLKKKEKKNYSQLFLCLFTLTCTLSSCSLLFAPPSLPAPIHLTVIGLLLSNTPCIFCLLREK